jgi:hypothetical protein
MRPTNTARRLAIGLAGLLVTGGAAAFALAGAGAAAAAPPPAVASTGTNIAAVVPTAISIADNTPSISFGAGTAIPGNAYTGTISVVATSNDAAGNAVSAVATNGLTTGTQASTGQPAGDSGLWNGKGTSPYPASDFIPFQSTGPFQGLFVQANGTGPLIAEQNQSLCPFGPTAGAGCSSYSPIDSATGTLNAVTYNDVWTLDIPNGQLPGTYNGSIWYDLQGN